MALYRRKNRSPYDIIASILNASQKGAGKTQIMYRANLSYRLRNEYMEVLVYSGLLERRESRGRAVYFIGKDGATFLETYQRMQVFSRRFRRFYSKKKLDVMSNTNSPLFSNRLRTREEKH